MMELAEKIVVGFVKSDGHIDAVLKNANKKITFLA
jgi:hypothetical protein